MYIPQGWVGSVFLPSGRVSGFLILLGSGCYGSVDIFLGQQILTSGLVRVQIFFKSYQFEQNKGISAFRNLRLIWSGLAKIPRVSLGPPNNCLDRVGQNTLAGRVLTRPIPNVDRRISYCIFYRSRKINNLSRILPQRIKEWNYKKDLLPPCYITFIPWSSFFSYQVS